MDNQSDLLPWILGALSIAAIAGAVTVGSTYKNSSSASRPVIEATAALPSAVVARPLVQESPPTAAAVVAQPVDPAPPNALPAAGAPQSTGQIWECTIHGEKTFSNNPCGDHSSLREVAPINTMEATRVLTRARTYPTNGGAYTDSYAAEPDDAYSSAPETSSNGYPVYVAGTLVEHRRSDRNHHPFARDRMPSASPPPRPPSPPPPPRTH
jgi:hypothetical protein